MTAETKDAPTADLAIAPARDLLKDAIVAFQAKPKNFIRIAATMLSLIWTWDAARVQRRLNCRASGRNSSIDLSNCRDVICTSLCWIVPSGNNAALMTVNPNRNELAPMHRGPTKLDLIEFSQLII
jgi:hypothetical protein